MTGARRIVAGPFNRVEGDLEVRLDVEDGRVAAAFVNSPLFRGFEQMLLTKDPRDALTLTPRICGICSVSQSAAAARALAAAGGVAPPPLGALAAALIHGTENVADHLTHFYLFFMPDFARPAYAGAPWHGRMAERFTAAEGSGLRAAIAARAQLLHVMGILAGKWPHTLAIQPAGVTRAPDARDRVRIMATLRTFRAFLEKELFAAPLEAIAALDGEAALSAFAAAEGGGDMRLFLEAAETLGLAAMGRGPGGFMSYGAYGTEAGHLFAPGLAGPDRVRRPVPFDAIREDGAHAFLADRQPLHPFEGRTHPDPEMAEPGYTFCKAPRIEGATVEVGALARQVVDGHPLALVLAAGGGDVRARVVGRLLEIARTVPALEAWAAALVPGGRYMDAGRRVTEGAGAGLVEAARGSLGHWLSVKDGKIANYQIVSPTTWNFSPRDAAGTPGPLEAALVGTPVRDGETTPVAVQHVVRSFDPCMVCTVH